MDEAKEAAGGSPATVADRTVHDERVRRLITRMTRAEPMAPFSKQLPEEDWSGFYTTGTVIEPPVNPLYLAEEQQYSATLGTGLRVMVTNVHGMGHTWVPDSSLADAAEKQTALNEARAMDALLNDLCPELGWQETRMRFGGDYEGVGYAGLEVLRDNAKNAATGLGKVIQALHIPAHQFRLCRQDKEFTDAFFWRFDSKTRTWEPVPYKKRFRRFAQIVRGKIQYFKEYGDPRDLDCVSGQYGKPGTIPEDRAATELLYLCQYTPGTPYGLPRWWPAFLSIEGGRKSDELNIYRLDNNGIPPLLILLLGATLDPQAWEDYKTWFSSVQGKSGYTRPLFMEAEKTGPENPIMGGGTKPPDVEVIKLADMMPTDAMYLEYGKQCDERVRTCFRFGDLYYGRSNVQNFATANVELAMGTSQVFGPEQHRYDWMVNQRVLPELEQQPLRNRFASKGPVLEDNDQWLRAMDLGFKYGVITDQDTGARLLEEVLGTTLPRSDKPWAALPFVLAQMLMTAGAFTPDGELDPMFGEEPPDPTGTGTPAALPPGTAPAETEEPEAEPVARLIRWTRAMTRRTKGSGTQAEVIAEAVLRALLKVKAEAGRTAPRDWSDPKPAQE